MSCSHHTSIILVQHLKVKTWISTLEDYYLLFFALNHPNYICFERRYINSFWFSVFRLLRKKKTYDFNWIPTPIDICLSVRLSVCLSEKILYRLRTKIELQFSSAFRTDLVRELSIVLKIYVLWLHTIGTVQKLFAKCWYFSHLSCCFGLSNVYSTLELLNLT